MVTAVTVTKIDRKKSISFMKINRPFMKINRLFIKINRLFMKKNEAFMKEKLYHLKIFRNFAVNKAYDFV